MKFLRAAREEELGEGKALRLILEGRPVALVKANGLFYAVDDTCTHERESLSAGFVDNFTIECPRHGAIFDLRSGKALTLPATKDLAAYPVKVENGEIFISMNE
jgi:3-phenylpropionate/trans-cinnamate dioxygenase ferredoxin subunit